MMKYLKIASTIFVLYLIYGQGIAQNAEKENIAVVPCTGWKGLNAITYQNALTDKILTRIIQSYRFNVIDRENLSKIMEEQGLQMSGAIDEASVVEFGRIAGVQKFIVGNFTQNSSEYHSAKYDKKGKKTADAYYDAEVQATLKMLDVETGVYSEAVEAGGSSKGKNERTAFFEALDEVAEKVVDGFFKYFAIQAFIESIDHSNAIIDRGTSLGVKRGMNFEILAIKKSEVEADQKPDITAETERIGTLRIVSAENNTAKARLIGDFSRVESGHLIRELKEKVALEASIVKKSWGEVVINLGQDVGLKKGTTFKVLEVGEEFVDSETGESYGRAEVQRGIIYVTSVQDRFARAKILKGRYIIKEGMALREMNRWMSGFRLGLTYTIAPITAEANNIKLTRTVDHKYIDKTEVTVDYTGKSDLDVASIVKINLGYYDIVNDNAADFSVGFAHLNEDLSALIFDLSLSHHFGILPEFLYVYPGVGLGFGIAMQTPESGVLSKLSKGNDNDLSSAAFEWFAQIGVRLNLGKFNIFGEADYMGMTFNKWKYDVKTGEEDDEGNDETESIQLDNELVPYPKVSFGGPDFRIGLSYSF
ncbi:hypothetical protein JXJ21_13920 [candidate division KSB1 bacterium]|nr:hypothetical protein [candidate division KSB1 bacterium]